MDGFADVWRAAGYDLDLRDAGDQRVDAADLRTVLTDDMARREPIRLRLSHAHVVGVLDLEAAVLVATLRFERCVFTDSIVVSEATITALRLIDCEVHRLEAGQLHTRGDFDLTGTKVT